MAVYWILFAFAALMSLRNKGPAAHVRGKNKETAIAMTAFALMYIAVGGLRHEVGGDWEPYFWLYTQISYSSMAGAMDYNDPLFGLLNWVSAQLGTGIYLVNLVICAILVSGVIRLARSTRDPWLAILIAVPYVLIVIGFGYVRQAAAIGLLLHAIVSLERHRRLQTILYLILAAGFHTTSLVMVPFFIVAISKRLDFYTVLLFALAAISYFLLLEPRLETLETRYIVAEYQSEGALIRLVMSALPALLLLARWKHFDRRGPSRPVWLLIAIGSIAILAVYVVSPSSTAVDRIALYFSVVQIVAFGELISLFNLKDRDAGYVRLVAIALAGAIQVVWLVYATHAIYWVPYKSILETV